MKIGDRVKVVDTEYKCADLGNGQEGVVLDTLVTEDGRNIAIVKLDNGSTPFAINPFKAAIAEAMGIRCDGWNYYFEELEVI